MPHIHIKMVPGRSEEQKERLAQEIAKDFVELFGQDENEVSVAIEEVDPADWKEKIYEAEILPNESKLYKKLGYTL
jgi:4-oxalocrotonate tautomerase